ncbi:putative cytokinin riboside 5'-monophosphate phosphoribohydrolase LOGL7 [Hypsizygus marmoreus]|uniref:Cytokinin riboside 5'-monophosphate phosphoribohydrolase LOGL7 n=1 Tax=Hypsizygus marmoreus TaxID=39966 RepID=A0A369JH77_HYPMA|nr:putative cytokinin riboside 5'-monophosphate phosphoribohydrolase LOGL7 [Hypsizygus marmoreus]
MASEPSTPMAIAVYCGSSASKRQAHTNAALSVGRALAQQNRPLVYGGGSHGLMGIVSNAVLEGGGNVTGIIPFAISAGGGERSKTTESDMMVVSANAGGKMQTVMVDSMHERKVAMAMRSAGFIGLPGGFGTYEEIFEVTTWTQLGIHNKPVVLLNVLSFFDPIRQLIENGIAEGYINPASRRLIVFIDGPTSLDEHENFDWGKAALEAIDAWQGEDFKPLFDWTRRKDGTSSAQGSLGAS